ncbi:hypothetical protein VTN02DRAFT_510 [Thermoascus thermophilus]
MAHSGKETHGREGLHFQAPNTRLGRQSQGLASTTHAREIFQSVGWSGAGRCRGVCPPPAEWGRRRDRGENRGARTGGGNSHRELLQGDRRRGNCRHRQRRRIHRAGNVAVPLGWAGDVPLDVDAQPSTRQGSCPRRTSRQQTATAASLTCDVSPQLILDQPIDLVHRTRDGAT